MTQPTIAIIGEFNSDKKNHVRLNQALDWLKTDFDFDYLWIATDSVATQPDQLARFSGIWSAPGSPFNSVSGSLKAIQYAREHNIPHLGTCAGFQHTMLEYARNVLGIQNADHAEYNTDAEALVIQPLTCSLSGKTMTVSIVQNSLAHSCYQQSETTEDYYCSFGLNPIYRPVFEQSRLRFSGIDQDNEIRIVELSDHRFFIATLFVPQSRMTQENQHPVIRGFVAACCLQ